MSLRKRLFFRVFIPVALLYFASTLLAVVLVEQAIIDNIDENLQLSAASSDALVGSLDSEQIEAALKFSEANPSARLAGLADPDRDTLLVPPARYGVPESAPDPDQFTYTQLASRLDRPFSVDSVDGELPYRVIATRIEGGRIVVIGDPLDRAHDIVGGLFVGAFILGVLILGVLALVNYLMVRSGLKPLDRFVATTSEIAEGDLSRRIEDAGDDPGLGRLATATNHMLDELEAGYEAQRQSRDRLHGLITDVSHELRTPLAVMRGAVDMNRMGMLDDPTNRSEIFTKVEAMTDRMSRIVEDVLVLARIEQGSESRDTADLSLIVDTVVEKLTAIYPGRQITVHPHGTDVMLRAATGDKLASRAVTEVIDNALRHTPDDAAVHIRFGGEEPPDGAGAVSVIVDDQGPGVPREIADHIFDRFVRPDSSRARATGGSGLGLTIARSICESTGGSMAYEATRDGGRFTLTFGVRNLAVDCQPIPRFVKLTDG